MDQYNDHEGKKDECSIHWIVIVLTIAHIHDPDPANCTPENLQALCQRCHNTLDALMRSKNAWITRRAKRAIGDLFVHA